MKLYYFLSIGAALASYVKNEDILVLEESLTTDAINLTAHIPSVKPNSTAGTLEAAYYNANYAGASYCELSTIRDWSCLHCRRLGNHVTVEAIAETEAYDTRAFVATDSIKKEIVLSFRGSANIINWIQNLKMFRKKYKLIPGAETHAGFTECADALLSFYGPIIHGLLAQDRFRDYKVVVVGHSLGGAIALLSALNLQEYLNLPWSKLSVFTYGQPRIGNLAFSVWLNSLPLTMTRIVNENDIVAHNPSLHMGYVHQHTEAYVNRNQTQFCGFDFMENPKCSRSRFPILSWKAHKLAWDIPLGNNIC